MSTPVCGMCASSSAQLHHVTGRSARGGVYLDQRFTLPVCCQCHSCIHQALRALGIEFPRERANGRELLAHRLWRFGLYLYLVADTERSLLIPASSLRGLSVLVNEAGDALDAPRDSHRGAA